MIDRLEYYKGFSEVCSGLGVDVREKVVDKCWRETNSTMKLDVLKRIFKQLEEDSERHPTYKQFLGTARSFGFNLQIETAKPQPELGSCTQGLCNGDGWLIVDKDNEDYIFRCSCQVGLGHSLIMTTKQGVTNECRIWDKGLEKQGYTIKTPWHDMKGYVNRSDTMEKVQSLKFRSTEGDI